MNIRAKLIIAVLGLFLLSSTVLAADAIEDYYDLHKNDPEMESKIIPPKMATLMIDGDEYPDAVDILMSLRGLKYLNLYGENEVIDNYANKALQYTSGFEQIFESTEKHRTITVFAKKKNGKIKKSFAVMNAYKHFCLVIAKGHLTDNQISKFPELAKEIQ